MKTQLNLNPNLPSIPEEVPIETQYVPLEESPRTCKINIDNSMRLVNNVSKKQITQEKPNKAAIILQKSLYTCLRRLQSRTRTSQFVSQDFSAPLYEHLVFYNLMSKDLLEFQCTHMEVFVPADNNYDYNGDPATLSLIKIHKVNNTVAPYQTHKTYVKSELKKLLEIYYANNSSSILSES